MRHGRDNLPGFSYIEAFSPSELERSGNTVINRFRDRDHMDVIERTADGQHQHHRVYWG